MNDIALVIPCHNQQDIIEHNLKVLQKQTVLPRVVIIIEDHSDKFTLDPNKYNNVFDVVVVENPEKGRSSTRNLGIKSAMAQGVKYISFMDGDSVPEDELYFERLLTHLEDSEDTLVFGTRIHQERPYDFDKWFKGENTFYERFPNKPSDLLTGNMDNLVEGAPLDYRDLREISEVVGNFNSLTNFHDKVDFILTGMVTWSCSFTGSTKAFIKFREFMQRTYSLNTWFDEETFKTQWGYEDIAFGLDAQYAGVNIKLQDDSRVIHFMHGRSDNPFTHITGKHILMERYRYLLRTIGQGGEYERQILTRNLLDVVINSRGISVRGRRFSANGMILVNTASETIINEDGVYNFENYKFDGFKTLKNKIVKCLFYIIKKLVK